jgi:hypothetical protein
VLWKKLERKIFFDKGPTAFLNPIEAVAKLQFCNSNR